jgi:hypothetical protein
VELRPFLAFVFFARPHERMPWCASNPHRVGRGFPKGRESPLGLHEMVRVSIGARTPFSAAGTWSMGFRGERSRPDHGGVRGSLEAPLTGGATAKRCSASRITQHVLTPNKVVADAPFVGQKWLGLWSEAAARGMQRESAKRLPCQDSPLDKPIAERGFVLQGDILQSA